MASLGVSSLLKDNVVNRFALLAQPQPLAACFIKKANMTHIDWAALPGLFTYPAYRQHIDELQAEGKTTGPDQSPAMQNYTQLNVARMRRLDKTTASKLKTEALAQVASIDRPMIWLSITEAWCGDAAQILPVIQQLADQNDLITHYLVLRDEHPELMDAFLTNGTARSIPITIAIDAASQEVLGHWGPRPAELQSYLMDIKAKVLATDNKEAAKAINDQAKIDTQKWYARDKTQTIQEEFLSIL